MCLLLLGSQDAFFLSFFFLSGSPVGPAHCFVEFVLLFKSSAHCFPRYHRTVVLRDFSHVSGGQGAVNLHTDTWLPLRSRALSLFLMILPAH